MAKLSPNTRRGSPLKTLVGRYALWSFLQVHGLGEREIVAPVAVRETVSISSYA